LPDKYKVLAQELNRNIEKQHKYSDSLVWIACIFMGIHAHLSSPPAGDKLGICDKREEIFF
jgi:hypothetical protein